MWYTVAYCFIVQIMLYLCCRSLIDIVGHVRGHMIIEMKLKISFEE